MSNMYGAEKGIHVMSSNQYGFFLIFILVIFLCVGGIHSCVTKNELSSTNSTEVNISEK